MVVTSILLITVIPSGSKSVKLHQLSFPSKPVGLVKQQAVTVNSMRNKSSPIHRVKREPAMHFLTAILGIFAPKLITWDAIDAAGNDNRASRDKRSPFMTQFLPHAIRINPHMMSGIEAVKRGKKLYDRQKTL